MADISILFNHIKIIYKMVSFEVHPKHSAVVEFLVVKDKKTSLKISV